VNKRWRNVGLYVLAVITVIFIGTSVFDKPSTESSTKTLRYSDFIEAVQDKEISRVLISPDNATAQVVENDGSRSEVNLAPDKDLLKILTENNVDIAVTPTKLANPWQQAISSLIFPVLLIGGLFFLFRRSQSGNAGGGNPAMSFGKSKARLQMEPSTQVTFSDVAGVEGAKLELTEVVDFLKSPDRFTAVGAKIPKGVLLVGPPGTGKTLLAKAVAGEAGVPFFSISGSEVVEMFVGVGASRVRDLFEQAKKNAPCIVFIDEIDAVGRQRGAGMGGGNDEREQTLNQLLTEMDGFASADKPVIVLAATNQPEVLDAALLRPGRFDRQVLVDRPDLSGRKTILEIYTKKVKLADSIDLDSIAQATSGFAGADLANMVNEAALLAARAKRKSVEQQDLSEAIERVVAGLEKKSRVLQDDEKKVVAYHEVGHAIVGHLMPGGSKVAKISIVPRGMSALGYTLQLPTEERFLNSKEELKGQIATLLGGRSAEEVVFGKITTGASNDLQRATDIAEQMVGTFGMSDILGPLAYDKQGGGQFLGNGNNPRRSVSDATAQAIDKEVRDLVDDAHETALNILRNNLPLLESISQKILQEEVIEGEDLKTLLAESKMPA